MTTEELVNGFIKLLEEHRRNVRHIDALRYELEKWEAVAISAIPEEALLAALNKYDLESEISKWN
jgi:hypothetical protein